MTLYGLAERKNFRKNLRSALDRGLTEEDALAALTTVPAAICGVANELGTIEKGKIANLTVVAGSYFNPSDKVQDVWVNGRPFRVTTSAEEKKNDEKQEEKAKEAEKAKLAATRLASSPQEGRGVPASQEVSSGVIATAAKVEHMVITTERATLARAR